MMNLFYGAITLGYRHTKKAHFRKMNQTGNPEMMDLMEDWGKEGAADDREVTEMFRGKTNISNTEEEQVRSF